MNQTHNELTPTTNEQTEDFSQYNMVNSNIEEQACDALTEEDKDDQLPLIMNQFKTERDNEEINILLMEDKYQQRKKQLLILKEKLHMKGKELEEKLQVITHKEAELVQRSKALESEKAEVDIATLELRHKEKENLIMKDDIQNKIYEYRKKRDNLTEKEKDLKKMNRIYENKCVDLTVKSEKLNQIEQEILFRTSLLKEKETNFREKETEFEAKETELERKIKVQNKKVEEIKGRDIELKAKIMRLDRKKMEIHEKEEEMRQMVAKLEKEGANSNAQLEYIEKNKIELSSKVKKIKTKKKQVQKEEDKLSKRETCMLEKNKEIENIEKEAIQRLEGILVLENIEKKILAVKMPDEVNTNSEKLIAADEQPECYIYNLWQFDDESLLQSINEESENQKPPILNADCEELAKPENVAPLSVSEIDSSMVTIQSFENDLAGSIYDGDQQHNLENIKKDIIVVSFEQANKCAPGEQIEALLTEEYTKEETEYAVAVTLKENTVSEQFVGEDQVSPSVTRPHIQVSICDPDEEINCNTPCKIASWEDLVMTKSEAKVDTNLISSPARPHSFSHDVSDINYPAKVDLSSSMSYQSGISKTIKSHFDVKVQREQEKINLKNSMSEKDEREIRKKEEGWKPDKENDENENTAEQLKETAVELREARDNLILMEKLYLKWIRDNQRKEVLEKEAELWEKMEKIKRKELEQLNNQEILRQEAGILLSTVKMEGDQPCTSESLTQQLNWMKLELIKICKRKAEVERLLHYDTNYIRDEYVIGDLHEKINEEEFMSLMDACKSTSITEISIWINYSDVSNQMYQYMRNKNVLTDCTIRVGDTEFEAHRAILSAHSKFFESIFLEDQYSENSIFVNSNIITSSSVFNEILNFIYTGIVNVEDCDKRELIETLSKLKIDICEFV